MILPATDVLQNERTHFTS